MDLVVKVSSLKFPAGKVYEVVKVRVWDVDRARSDPRNLLTVILEVQNEEFNALRDEEYPIDIHVINSEFMTKHSF